MRFLRHQPASTGPLFEERHTHTCDGKIATRYTRKPTCTWPTRHTLARNWQNLASASSIRKPRVTRRAIAASSGYRRCPTARRPTSSYVAAGNTGNSRKRDIIGIAGRLGRKPMLGSSRKNLAIPRGSRTSATEKKEGSKGKGTNVLFFFILFG